MAELLLKLCIFFVAACNVCVDSDEVLMLFTIFVTGNWFMHKNLRYKVEAGYGSV